MKVVQFTPYFPPHKGGLEVVAENISKHLVQQGGKVINITSSIQQKSIKETRDGYEIWSIPSFEIIHNFPCPKFWERKFRQIMKDIKKEHPDIIQTHTRFFLQTFLGGIVAKRLHKPRVHVEHGSGHVTGMAKRKEIIAWMYDQTLGRITFSCCNKIVSINQANLLFVQKFVSKKKCEVIYNGIEIPHIAQDKRENSPHKKLVYIGRLIGLKAVNILIDACKHLVDQEVYNFSLDIIGDGEERQSLQDQTKKLHLEKYIHFLGAKNHDEIITQILPHTHILINPSLQEGLPTTVLEGLLAGCVVVATDVGGTREISNKPDLLLVPAGDSKLLGERIKKALDEYSKVQGNSQEHIKETFDWTRSARKYLQIYTNLTQK